MRLRFAYLRATWTRKNSKKKNRSRSLNSVPHGPSNYHFNCTTSNIIYCISCTHSLQQTLHRRIWPQIRWPLSRTFIWCEKLKGSDLSKSVARHFQSPRPFIRTHGNLRNYKTRKRREQRRIFKLGTLAPNGINERFHSHSFKHIFDQLDATNFNQWQNMTFRSAWINYQLFKHWFYHNPSVCSNEGLTLETSVHTKSNRRKPYYINFCWSNPYSAYSPTQIKLFFQN